MPSPQLLIRRLVVFGELELDLPLRGGVNVLYADPDGDDVRRTNKAGKTALVELIQHGLGKRQGVQKAFHLAPIRDQIDRMFLETEINGRVFTVERSLLELTARVALREQRYDPQILNTPAELISVEDLSRVYLDRLGIPELQVRRGNEGPEPLSFPNLMRGFILHQADSFSAIIDKSPPERRKEIIGLLSGIIPPAAFHHEAEVGALAQQVRELQESYASITRFLRANQVPVPELASQQVDEASRRLQAATAARQALQESLQAGGTTATGDQRSRLSELRAELLALRESRHRDEQELAGLAREADRISALVASLRTDLQKSRRVQASSTILSTVEFSTCPRCLLAITEEMRRREEHSRCTLCSRPLRTTSDAAPRAVPKVADLEAQVAEAEDVLRGVVADQHTISERLLSLGDRETELSGALNRETRAFVSPALDALLAATREAGDAEVQLSRARALLEQSESAEQMRREWERLVVEIDEREELQGQRRRRSAARKNRLQSLYAEVLRAVDFPSRGAVRIDKMLMPSIGGFSYKHEGAALTGLAVTCFHLALLRLSLEADTYFPRLLVIDSPAVGDLNQWNHERLLDYIASLHEDAESKLNEDEEIPWQIILTTRRLTDRLKPYRVMTVTSRPGSMLLRRGALGKPLP